MEGKISGKAQEQGMTWETKEAQGQNQVTEGSQTQTVQEAGGTGNEDALNTDGQLQEGGTQ